MKIVLKNIYLLFGDIISIIGYIWNWFFYYLCIGLLEKSTFKPLPLLRDNNKGRTICVLANGPSLRADLDKILTDQEFQNVDFSVMNYFANDPLYSKIKPTAYCLWDPMFYEADDRYEKVMYLFNNINTLTNWDMNLYIRGSISAFKKYSHLNNPHLKIISISTPRINARRPIKNFFYRHGWALPYTCTVANVNMFTSVQMGYEFIRLYGADMTLFEGICVNNRNELCRVVSHFYKENGENELKPVYDHKLKKTQRLAAYVGQVLHMIEGHDDIAEYAESIGVKCLNCCEHSMLDCYPRK